MKSTNHYKKLTQHIRAVLCNYALPVFLVPFVFSHSAFANPEGGNIVGGSGSIGNSGTITNIQQNSSNLAIQWDSFNIQQNETVNFQQPNRSAIVLNRIMDVNPSHIQGAINANGQVIIANPNGVFFGPTANVNVGGLFAAALDIDPNDFMNGKLDFQALENTSGLIANEGTLKVIDGGTLALMGKQVKNSGLLVANFGLVNLAAGHRISVHFTDYTHVNISVSPDDLANILELDSTEVFNSGLIEAHGGRVVLTAQQASDIKTSLNPRDESNQATQFIEQEGVVYLTGSDGRISDLGGIDVSNDKGDAGSVSYKANTIQHNGSINADSQNGNGGKVSFDANDTTLLTGNSTISARSNKNGTGGEVKVLGNHVALTNNANINASGANGGGHVYIGGGYQGKDPSLKNADAVFMGKDTRIEANATEDGDGGQIIVWSEKASRVYGDLSATGGIKRGDGGLIETSSHQYVDLNPNIDVHANNGLHGEWLIDPASLVIQSGIDSNIGGGPVGPNFSSTANTSILGITRLQNALVAGANITVQTNVNTVTVNTPIGCVGAACTGTTQIDPNLETSAVANNSFGDITLAVDLDYDNAGTTTAPNSDNASSLTLRAHRDVIINGRIFDSDSDNGNSPFVPDVDILNLTLQADWGGNGGANQSGTAGRGTVRINNDIDLQGGNFTASGVNYIQSASASIDTRIPALTASSGFDPVVELGASAPLPNGSVTITVQNSATLGDITTRAGTGTLTVNANNGTITGPGILTIAGTTTLSATGDINLNNGANDFNTIPIDISNGANVTLADANNLTVNINNNSVTRISTNTGGDAVINDIDVAGTTLGAMTVGGNLDVNAAGSITTAGIVTINDNGSGNGNGISEFRVPNGASISLTNNNALNGTLNYIANTGQINNINVVNTSGINYQNGLGVAGNLSLRSLNQNVTLNNFTLGNASTLTLTADNGDIIQNNGINHAGNTVLSAAGDIFDPVMANNPINNLANVQINNATNASINNGGNAMVLNGVSNTNNLNVIAQGGVSETAGITVANNATFDTGTNALSLNSSTHNFNNLQISAAGSVQINEMDNLNIAGNMSSLDITTGIGGAASTLSNITDSPLVVTGATNLILQNGGSVNFANFTGALRNDLQSIINITSTTGSVNSVNLQNTSDILLGPLNVSNILSLDSSGNILQTGNLIVNGTSALQANNITLTQNNNFVGAVSITDSGVVQLNDTTGGINVIAVNNNASNTIDLSVTATGTIGVEGELLNANIATTTGNIQSTANLLVTNNTTLDAGASGNVDFQTNPVDLENINITQANNVQINDVDNLSIISAMVNGTLDITALGPVSVNGTINTLNVSTNNAITLSGVLANLSATTTAGGILNGTGALRVTGTSILDAAGSDINLTHAANDFNRLTIVNAQDTTINDANRIILQDINTRDFNLTTAGNITQSAGTQVVSTRNANINANNADITLTENNLFTAIGLNGNRATLVNNQALTLNDSAVSDAITVSTNNGNLSINQLTAANTITLTAADQLIDVNGDDVANIIADTAKLNAANGIGMSSHIDTRVRFLEATNANNGDINIKNSGGDITLNNIFNGATDTGNFNFETTDDVLINHIELQQNLTEAFFSNGTGTANLFTADGSYLGLGDADITDPDITATNVRIIGVKGTLGTIKRPIVMDVSGKVELVLRASLDPVYVEPVPAPDDIRDESILQFTSGNILSAINGLTLIDVENLLDISPAIFTEIYLFVVDSDPVMLPKDQRFDDGYTDEEDDEYFRQVTGDEKHTDI